MGHSQPFLRRALIVALIAAAAVAGYVVRDFADYGNETYGGRMIYGVVSEVRKSDNVVCIRRDDKKKDVICAPLHRGDLPVLDRQVRGWLVQLPFDVDYAEPDLQWAFVTTMSSG